MEYLEQKEILEEGDLRHIKSATFLRINSERKIFPASWQLQQEGNSGILGQKLLLAEEAQPCLYFEVCYWVLLNF